MRMPCVGFGVLLMAGCGGDGATVRDGGVDAAGADAAEGELVAEAISFADAEVPASFDVVPDVTGDGRDDVVIRYFSRQDGPEVVIARWSGGALERVASIESDGAADPSPQIAPNTWWNTSCRRSSAANAGTSFLRRSSFIMGIAA